jgi:hypothetical protein
MTDRIHSITVVLDHDIRDDDCDSLIAAIKHFRCVASVTPNVADPASLMAEKRAQSDLRRVLGHVIRAAYEPSGLTRMIEALEKVTD